MYQQLLGCIHLFFSSDLLLGHPPLEGGKGEGGSHDCKSTKEE